MVYIIIPARKNSKRLKNKNLKKINKMTLLDRTINFAKKIKFCKKIIVTTDIMLDKKNYDKKVLFIKRSKKLSGDKTKIYTVIRNVYRNVNNKLRLDENSTILLLQPTSPFRSIFKINKAYKKFLKFKKKYSVLSVQPRKNVNNLTKRVFNIKNHKLCLNLNKNKDKKNYIATGNFYFATFKFLKKEKSFYSEYKSFPIIDNSKKFTIDIDTKHDFVKTKKYLRI